MDRCLIVLAKEPVSGQVKTRLAAEIGERRATSLYEASLRDVVAVAAGLAPEVRLLISFSPARAARYFAQLAPGACLLVQPDGNLGARLQSAFEVAATLGFERALAIGSDAPHLPGEWLLNGLTSLEGAPLTLGPTRDGGYWAVGLARDALPRAAELFEGIRWSTPHTRADTERRAGRLGLPLAYLPETFDVDVGEDLKALREHLDAHPGCCAHSRAWFELAEHA